MARRRVRAVALGYAPPALRRLVGASDHDHCRVSGEGAAVCGHQLVLADSDYATDRLRLGQVSRRVLDDRLAELLVRVDVDRALLVAGGGDLVAQRRRQTVDRRAVEDSNGDGAWFDRDAAAVRLARQADVVRLRLAGMVTAVAADQLTDAVGGHAADGEQADEDRGRESADPAVPGLGPPRRDGRVLLGSDLRSSRLGDRPLSRGG